MKDFPETVFGVLAFAVGALQFWLSARFGRRAATVSLVAGIFLQVAVLMGTFFDWGYKWVHAPAYKVALEQNIWIATPAFLVVVILVLLASYGPGISPYLTAVAFLQAASFPVTLFSVGSDTDVSFLSPVPVASMYLSTESAFCFLAYGITCLPRPGSRFFDIAFGSRIPLIAAIQFLEKVGFAVKPPSTVLDSGSATGFYKSAQITLTTTPSLVPLGYGLQLTISRPVPFKNNPLKPGLAEREYLECIGTTLKYRGYFRQWILVSEASVWELIERYVGAA